MEQENLYFNFVWLLQNRFSYLSRGNENPLKSPWAVSQLIMRVSKPIQYDPKGEPWRIIIKTKKKIIYQFISRVF